ncbi:MAG: DsbA family oxidoreductase [Hyalangium sp.]|uniref:DsbA family oxidoreductase n=1 Tax=Hyalangium sp. TaxID=2028555 RepID=UPI00389A73B2
MKIDVVSDVVCPWCCIGFHSLEQALKRLGNEVKIELHLQPFELNPKMPASGQDIDEYMLQKYGLPPKHAHANREVIRERGATVGFTFNFGKRGRIYNTFDAHRLLHWAEQEGRQRELKRALFRTYFTDGQDPSNHEVLVRVAGSVGLDAARAREILASDTYAAEVREREHRFLKLGINSVPAVIIDDRHVLQGGQPPEAFEQALRQLAAAR